MRPLKSRDVGNGRKGTALGRGRVTGIERKNFHLLAWSRPRRLSGHGGLSIDRRRRFTPPVIAYFTTETECESDVDWNEVAAIITIIVVLTVALGGVWVIF
jgi:hypothetical protein